LPKNQDWEKVLETLGDALIMSSTIILVKTCLHPRTFEKKIRFSISKSDNLKIHILVSKQF
jgi:hypothetical protein